MRVLVTGGSGFIGRNLVEHLGKRHEVVAPGRSALDLTDSGQVARLLADVRPGAIVHSATRPGHRNAAPAPDLAAANLRMFFALVTHAAPSVRIVVLGSGAEYGTSSDIRKAREDDAALVLPNDDTGFSKRVMSAWAERDPRIVHLRPFGVFGKHEDWEIRFISNAICKALHGLPITLRQNRKLDYVFVSDLSRVVEGCLDHAAPLRVINVTPSETPDLLSLAHRAREACAANVPILVGREGLGLEYTGDGSRLRAFLPELELTPIDAAIGELARWYRDNLRDISRDSLTRDK